MSDILLIFRDLLFDHPLILNCMPIIEPRLSNTEHKNQVKDLQDDTGILSLPEELLTKIFLHFPRNFNLQTVGLVCQRFLQVVRLPIFVPYQNITLIAENDKNRALSKRSLVEIINVLKIYPECKLQLSLERGTYASMDPDSYSRLPMISFRKLEPFLLSVNDFVLDIGHCESNSLSVIPSLVNLKSLTLNFHGYDNDGCSENFEGINEVEVSFWEKFPNLDSLCVAVDEHRNGAVSLI